MYSSCFAKCKMWTIQETMKVNIKQMKDLAKRKILQVHYELISVYFMFCHYVMVSFCVQTSPFHV